MRRQSCNKQSEYPKCKHAGTQANTLHSGSVHQDTVDVSLSAWAVLRKHAVEERCANVDKFPFVVVLRAGDRSLRIHNHEGHQDHQTVVVAARGVVLVCSSLGDEERELSLTCRQA